jgi:hypothetical protein
MEFVTGAERQEVLGSDGIGGGGLIALPQYRALAPPVDGGLELPLVHLRTTLDSETLGLAVKLFLRTLPSLRHE